MCHRLQDGAQRLEADRHVQQVSGEEEVVEVSQEGETEVPRVVEERLEQTNNIGYRYPTVGNWVN